MGKGNRIRQQKQQQEVDLKRIQAAIAQGEQQGVMKTMDFLQKKLDGLVEVPGIGPALRQRIITYFLTNK